MRVRERERAGATDRQSESLRESLVLERGECLSVRAIHSCFVYSVHCVLERGERGTGAGARVLCLSPFNEGEQKVKSEEGRRRAREPNCRAAQGLCARGRRTGRQSEQVWRAQTLPHPTAVLLCCLTDSPVGRLNRGRRCVRSLPPSGAERGVSRAGRRQDWTTKRIRRRLARSLDRLPQAEQERKRKGGAAS